MFDPPQLPPPGWYPDPDRYGGTRYWSGTAWGETDWEWESRWGSQWGAPGGPVDAYPDVGDLLNLSFQAMWNRWRALAGLALITLVPAGILLSLTVWRGLSDVRIVDDEVYGWSNNRIPELIAGALIAILLYALGTLGSTWLMLRTIDTAHDVRRTAGDEFRAAGEAFVAAARILPRAIGWSLVAGAIAIGAMFVIVLLFVVALPVGVIAIVAAIPLMVWLSVRLAFLSQSIVDRPGNPFGRAWETTRDRFWATFGRLAIMGLIVYALSLVLSIPASLASGGGFGGFGGTRQFEVTEDGTSTSFEFGDVVGVSAWSIVIGALVTVLTAVFATGLINAALAALYRTRNPRY